MISKRFGDFRRNHRPTVLIDAEPWLAVPPRGYGGVQTIIATLVPQLRARGIRVVLATVGDSDIECDEMIWRFQEPRFAALSDGYRPMGVALSHMQVVRDYVIDHPEVDVVHVNTEIAGPATMAAMGEHSPPTLHTVHWDTRRQSEFYESFDGGGRVWVNGVSRRQQSLMPAALRAQSLGVVLHASPTLPPRPPPPPTAPFVVLGRVSLLKGQHIAARLCHELEVDLVIAGPINDATDAESLASSTERLRGSNDFIYWNEHVRPLVDGNRVKWIGAVTDTATRAAKSELLTGARALLMPVQWEEPGAAVVVEALAAGTPVIGMRRGVLPELVEHGITGYLADTEDEFRHYMSIVDSLDRSACRTTALDRFSPTRLADDYVELYDHTIVATRTAALAEETG